MNVVDITYFFGVLLMFVGIIGYSFQPPPQYVPTIRILTSISLTYSIFGLIFFISTLCEHVKYIFIYEYTPTLIRICELALLTLLVSIALYGVKCLKNVWYFEIARIKDILIYGCIVYLMNKEFARFIYPYTVYLNIAVSVLSALIAILSVYVILKLSKFGIFLSFENYELVSIIYLIVFFIGLESASGVLTVMSLPYVLAIILNAYSLYIIIAKFVKPILDV